MRRTAVAVGMLVGLALAGAPTGRALGQSRVLVPIVIQAPRATVPSAAAPSVRVTTRTASPRPGVTTTRVTVRDTTGAGRTMGGPPPLGALTTVRPGTPSVLIRIDRQPAPIGVGEAGRTRVTVEDVSASNRALGGPAPLSLQQSAGRGHETLIITSDAPIDAPIVILAP